jgi:hypothetical protein
MPIPGRRVTQKAMHDGRFRETMTTLRPLDDERLTEVLVRSWKPQKRFASEEYSRIFGSSDPIDRAIYFLYQASGGSGGEKAALCRNTVLLNELEGMMVRVNRVLARRRRPVERKKREQKALKSKLRSLRSDRNDPAVSSQ